MNIVATAPEAPRRPEQPTMSSHEIADLCEKRPDHVLRDIEKMIQDIDNPNFGAVDFEAKYQDAKGEWRKAMRKGKS